MMRSVLISIKPKWCELISSGKKTIEVRKTKPKLETPFKCYIYCTNTKPYLVWGDVFRGSWETEFTHISGYNRKEAEKIWDVFNGHVIGEFVCDKILDVFVYCSDPNMKGYPFPCTGLTDREVMDYLGNGNMGYGWHISNLVIYDEPKPLDMFYKECAGLNNTGMCYECENAVGEECDCAVNGQLHLTRPPQSWCYVERCK